MAGRVKIKTEHPRKTFCERVLFVWRQQLEDTDRMRYVLWKAHGNLKLFPLEVDGIAELKMVNGVGDTLAVRLNTAWDLCCETMGRPPTWREVKALSSEELYSYCCGSKTAKMKEKESKRINRAANNAVAEDPSDEFVEKEKPKKRPIQRSDATVGVAKKKSPMNNEKAKESSSNGARALVMSIMSDDEEEFMENRQTVADEVLPSGLDNFVSSSQIQPSSQSSSTSQTSELVTARPEDHAEVILICDNRESVRGVKKAKGVVDFLQSKQNIRVESRTLSVGDFLWIARFLDGTEVVIDWVVERKTWQDLTSSIRQGRYEEQKQRLRASNFSHKVLLVEGKGTGDQACRQAMCSTQVVDQFMVVRCDSPNQTASFLHSLTKTIMKHLQKNTFTGIHFEYLQEKSKKSKAETVKETWIRQLMVCPGMSDRRASQVAHVFPSISSIIDFIRSGGSLHKSLPQLPPSLITQLTKFFTQQM